MIAEFLEHHAPEGTYQNLTSLENGRLGNSRTKRFIRVLIMPEIWPSLKDSPHLKDNMAVAEVRVREPARGDKSKSYFFGIDPTDRMVLLAAWEYESSQNQQPIEPASAAELLKEIATAQKLQPTLKS